jgi:hypothetical protein
MRLPAVDAQFRRRALFVAVNVTFLAVVLLFIALPMHTFFVERDDRIGDKHKVLARLSAIASEEPKLQSVLGDTAAQLRGGEFLTGANDNVISADLQTRLKAMTEAAGARSRAVQALPWRTIDQVRYVGSRIEIFGPLQSVQRVVHAIEDAKPYLFVNGAVIRSQLAPGGQGTSEEPVIQAHLEVFGAVQVQGREP